MNLHPGDKLDIVAAADNTLVVEKHDRRERALANMRARRWATPQGFKFDRDAANER
jgi:antitoxin component of MazEF toxin-antitoxin module